MMATEQKAWNQQQKELCRILMRFDRHDEALSLFLRQHAVLHTAAIAPRVNWSFAE